MDELEEDELEGLEVSVAVLAASAGAEASVLPLSPAVWTVPVAAVPADVDVRAERVTGALPWEPLLPDASVPSVPPLPAGAVPPFSWPVPFSLPLFPLLLSGFGVGSGSGSFSVHFA